MGTMGKETQVQAEMIAATLQQINERFGSAFTPETAEVTVTCCEKDVWQIEVKPQR